jgi:signal transduction histidine kinase/CheY-like chemotaxis protein
MLAPLEQAWKWTQGAALAVAAIALTALAGYAYGVEALYAVDPFGSMALHTSLGFGVLALAVLFTPPARGVVALVARDTTGGTTARRYLPFALAVPLVVGWLQVRGEQLGLYQNEFGTGIAAVGSAFLLFGLVWRYAWWLERSEARRADLEVQLLRSQKMESIGRLAGGIAHDFNNVLTIVMTTAELLQRETEDSHVRDDLQTIRDAGQSARALTKQLLALGRRQVLHTRVVNLNDILTENEGILRRLVPEPITCDFRPGTDIGNVRVDPGKLEQVLINLIVNAVDSMPHGGRLTIETRNAELDQTYTQHHVEVTPGPYVVMLVSDTGTGMEGAIVEHIFEPFFTTKPAGKGTGLGLSTAYGMVKQSGGHIWVYSEVGHGTTFKIYLPRVDAVAQPLVKRPAPRRERTGLRAAVLVVDDEDRVRDVVAKVLTRAGYAVHTAANGVEALRFLASHPHPIDLVLTDVMMPEMGAGELTHELRTVRPQTKVLYMSGYADDRIVLEGLDRSGDALLEKPFTPDELLDRVRDVLDAPT